MILTRTTPEQVQADWRDMVGMSLDAPHGQRTTLDTPAAEQERREAAAHRIGQHLGAVLADETANGTHDPRQLGQVLAELLASLADGAYMALVYNTEPNPAA